MSSRTYYDAEDDPDYGPPQGRIIAFPRQQVLPFEDYGYAVDDLLDYAEELGGVVVEAAPWPRWALFLFGLPVAAGWRGLLFGAGVLVWTLVVTVALYAPVGG